MIIKATFGDNDFTQLLEKFFKKFHLNLGYSEVDGKPDELNTQGLLDGLGNTLKEVLRILDSALDEPLDIPELEDIENKKKLELRFKDSFDYRHFNELYHKEQRTKSEKKFICEYIKSKILLFIMFDSSINNDSKEYLKEKLVVTLPAMVRDTWENGESVYYFVEASVSVTV